MAVIVMTSNLGTGESAPAGFGERAARDHATAVRRHFKPELLGRIDHIIEFRSLSRADIGQIVDLEITEASRRIGLKRREIDLRLTEGARRRLAELGFDPLMGARPLKRVIEERVVARLAVRIAEDPELRDCVVRILPAGEDDVTLEIRRS
jgi:ATP-dependent Clp protease ATP-binding subunit ClpA